MNRRGFFKISGGAAIAAPSIAQTMLHQSQSTKSYGYSIGTNSAGRELTPSGNEAAFLKDTIAQLTSFYEDVESKVRDDYSISRADSYNHMRSLSPSARSVFQREADIRSDVERRKSYIQTELGDLKRRLGVLGEWL